MLILLSLCVNLGCLLLRANFLLYLVVARITSLNIKLWVVHLSRCLIKIRFLVGAVSSILVKFVCEVSSVYYKVVVSESQSSSFEVTVFISVWTGHRIVVVVIVGVALLFSQRSLVLWTNLGLFVHFRVGTSKNPYWFFKRVILRILFLYH